MRIVVARKDLLPLLSRTKGSADAKSAMPVLANVLLTAARGPLDSANGSVSATTTDLYRLTRGSRDAEVSEPGSVAVPAVDLFDRIKAMDEGPIVLESDDVTRLTIRAAKGPRRYAIHGISGAEWPRMPEIDPAGDGIEIPAAALSKMLARVLFSVSSDTTRPPVNSVKVELAHDRIRVVSTDGHRLSKNDHVLPGCSVAEWLIPLSAATEIARLAGEQDEGNVRITHSEPWLFLEIAGVTFGTKLIDPAGFPPYEQVIPAASSGTSVRVEREQAIAAVRAVALASARGTGGVHLVFTPGGQIVVKQETAENGSAADEITPLDAYAGPALTIGSNAAYMLAPLSALDCGEVTLTVGSEIDPITIRPVGLPEGEDYVAVVMPMRI